MIVKKTTSKPRNHSDEPIPEALPEVTETPKPQPPPYAGPVVVMFDSVQSWLYTRELMTVTSHTLNGGQILVHARAIECLNQAVPNDKFISSILDHHYQERQQEAAKEREKLRVQAEAEAYERNKVPNAKPIVANTPGTFKKRS